MFSKGKGHNYQKSKTKEDQKGSFHKALKFLMKLYKNPALTFIQQKPTVLLLHLASNFFHVRIGKGIQRLQAKNERGDPGQE